MSDITTRLNDEADLCRNDGADDIARLLGEAAAEIERLRSALQRIASSLDESYRDGSMERTLGDCAREALTPQQPAPSA